MQRPEGVCIQLGEVLPLEPRQEAAVVVFVEIAGALETAGEKTTPQRAVGDETDPQFAQGRQSSRGAINSSYLAPWAQSKYRAPMSRSRPMLPGQHVCFSLVSLAAAACATTPAPTPELQEHEAAPAFAESDAAPSSSLVPSHVEFAFVIVGSSAGKAFTSAVPMPGPALLSEVWVGAWPEVLDKTVERAFGSAEQRWKRPGEEALVELDAVELARRGFEAPSDPLWLIGPEGPCRVRLTTPGPSCSS